jgi:hypothetical protein
MFQPKLLPDHSSSGQRLQSLRQQPIFLSIDWKIKDQNLKYKKDSHLSISLRLTLIFGSIMLLMLACNLTNRVAGMLPTNTPEPTVTPIPSPTLAPKKSGGTPTGQPSGGSASCYQGSWELKNISDLITPILVLNKIQNVQYTGSTGSLALSFTPDGKMTLLAKQFHSLFSAKLAFIPVTVDVLIDGSGSGDYSLDKNGRLLISNPDFGGISFSVRAASIDIIPATALTSLIPALQGVISGQTANLGSTCIGDSLSLDPGISGAPPLNFTRIKQ